MGTSIREIARQTGVSVATVSRALRGIPVVSPKARLKVERCARRLGYTPLALVGAVLSSVRRRQHGTFVGNLAAVALRRSPEAPLLPFQQRQLAGAKARSRALGFNLSTDYYTLGETKPSALLRMLHSRGVKGVIFLNSNETIDLSDLDWRGLAAVQIDFPLMAPHIATVGLDHHRTLHAALKNVSARGYRKIGFFVERAKDVRLAYKWSGAFLGYQNGEGTIGRVPILEPSEVRREEFLRWFRQHTPDLLVGHRTEALDWLASEGIHAPGDFGFFTLNFEEAGVPCAGLSLCPEAQGEAAAGALVGQVLRFESALQPRPESILIEGALREGPTLRPLA